MFPRNGADHLLRVITPTGTRSTEAQALRFTPPELAALYDALGIYLDFVLGLAESSDILGDLSPRLTSSLGPFSRPKGTRNT